MVGQQAFIAVYIMASGRNGTLYTGVTSELVTRVQQHKLGVFEGFSKTYGCKRLGPGSPRSCERYGRDDGNWGQGPSPPPPPPLP